jgi:hypothetical protein
VLEYGSTENCQFGAKTNRNSIFLVHDPRIVNRLSITVSYFNFYEFWKISHFCLKSMGVSLRFDRKLPVRGKNWSKLRISWSWPPYCESVIYNGPVFQFSRVLKIFTFLLEIQRCYRRFSWKFPVRGKNWSKLRIYFSWPRIANRLSITVPYFNLQGFWKFSHFCSKSMGVSLRFDQKLPVRGKNWSKLHISRSWPPYCESVIYNGPVFQFLRVLKIFTFLLEIQMC